MTTLSAALAAAATSRRGVRFPSISSRVFSWAEIHEHALRLAERWAAGGVGPGAHLFFEGGTGPDAVVAIQAAWLSGAGLSIVRPGQVPTGLGPELPTTRLVARGRARLWRGSDEITPRDCVLQQTSGTTGLPRTAVISRDAVVANASAIAERLDLDPSYDIAASWLPLFHDMGLMGLLAVPMLTGTTAVLTDPIAVSKWLRLLAEHRATITAAPPFYYAAATTSRRAFPRDSFSSLRVALIGSDLIHPAVPARFIARFAAAGIGPCVATASYGGAEAGLAVTIANPRHGLGEERVDPWALQGGEPVARRTSGGVRLARVGRPVLGAEVRVVHDGHVVGNRVLGEVEVRGRAALDRYEGATPRDPTDWIETGDVGYLSDDELVVAGRRADWLTTARGPLLASPVELEIAVQLRSPGVVITDGCNDEGLGVVIEGRHESEAIVASRALGELLGTTGSSIRVVPRGSLPRTTSGKVQRHLVRARYCSRQRLALSQGGSR